ncbi:MAG: amidohydrolase family protein [Sandaracinus sp.]|nr:amidohydrolase family protein [Sandaracinus sp.]MCB9620262.1 amidohydrolase family protein [Sandaracinus sp.]MCB9623762.1 amidohydrolase family protein [Sandaracinus sp.]MCB9635503.1 amidohydrolase family protein [Sandaracinus sp.]MCB9636943.1 amidohydrolase family protein [Sandaracinus sp.]
MHDLVIRGGTIVDGTGRERFTGDVAVQDGRIVAVGKVDGAAKRTIDASGAVVTPGFTDVHTHYDGQISWDEELAPSSIHGVTTAVLGSCGVGFAPVRPTDHQTLIELMEGVEDIPGSALAEGIKWGWESFGEYMETLDRMPHAIDFLCQVPHDALRVYVMGERAVADEAATEKDIETMRALLRAALEEGAVGFSTGRSDNHRSVHGAATPASESTLQELVGLGRAFEGLSHGVIQAVSDFDMNQFPKGERGRFDEEFDLLIQMARAAKRPMSISTMQRDHSPNQWRWILEGAQKAVDEGLDIRCQVGARAIGIMLGLQATFHPFMGFPSYKAIAHLPLEERVAKMRDPELKARMLKEKSDPVSGDGTPIPPLADHFLQNLDLVAMRLFRLGEDPQYEPSVKECFAAEAMRRGEPVLGVIYDALLEQGGEALLYFPLYNYTGMNLDVVHEMLSHPLALPGLSDGGAHVGTVCDASFPTFLMTHWARDRANHFPLEKMIKMQAHDTARFVGLTDRGTVAVGQKADLNVIDFDRLRLTHPKMQRDLPAGGQRLMQRAVGYLATIASGVVIAENGALTGARPGRLVRSGR